MISFVENVVIFTSILTILIIGRLVISQQQTQRAIRWWYRRQHLRMCQEADLIRNQMLQELFVLRRHIELSQLNSSETHVTHLEEENLYCIQKMHSSLKELSEYFYPAHLDDSLPLAIRCFFESWKLRLSLLDIQLKLPEIWNHNSEEINRTLLMIINEIMEVISSHDDSLISIFVNLDSDNWSNQLQLEMLDFNASKSDDSPPEFDVQEFKYLCHIFQTLTSGKSTYYQKESRYIWHFSW